MGPAKSHYPIGNVGAFPRGKPNAFSRGKRVELNVSSVVFLQDVFRVNINLFVIIFVLLCWQYCFITLFHTSNKSEVHIQILCVGMRTKLYTSIIREITPKVFPVIFYGPIVSNTKIRTFFTFIYSTDSNLFYCCTVHFEHQNSFHQQMHHFIKHIKC